MIRRVKLSNVKKIIRISAEEKNTDYLKIGGAVRFNTLIENYEQSNGTLDTGIKFDTWFLSADAHRAGFDLSLQYRFYPESKTHFLHHAYIGYTVSPKWNVKFGAFQRPFCIGDFASHSWWFQVPYYLGLEDGYGTGIGARYQTSKIILDLAYFRQAVPRGPVATNSEDNSVGNGRYSYAIVPTTGFANGELIDASIRELDQFNLRLRYNLTSSVEIGASGQFGSIYNQTLEQRRWGLNWAAHVVYDYRNLNFKGEVIGYDFNARGDNGASLDVLQMAAYGSAYDVATEGTIYVAGIGYTIPLPKSKIIKSIQPYVDYSVVDKRQKDFHDTYHLVTGFLINANALQIHVDYAMGRNQPWLTSHFGQGLGQGVENARWNGRFNINIGYYF